MCRNLMAGNHDPQPILCSAALSSTKAVSAHTSWLACTSLSGLRSAPREKRAAVLHDVSINESTQSLLDMFRA
jgi:hypothetical protein